MCTKALLLRSTAFIATVSKGAVFSLALRLFGPLGIQAGSASSSSSPVIAILSMFAGNLLALLQQNVKRILAYSSISHMGYLLIALLAGGHAPLERLGLLPCRLFRDHPGCLRRGERSVHAGTGRRPAWRITRGWPGADPGWRRVLTAMLLSLAGIPLTAGFVAKFYLAAAGVGSGLWLLVIMLVINSALGLFYYLRIIAAVYTRPEALLRRAGRIPAAGARVFWPGSAWLWSGSASIRVRSCRCMQRTEGLR